MPPADKPGWEGVVAVVRSVLTMYTHHYTL